MGGHMNPGPNNAGDPPAQAGTTSGGSASREESGRDPEELFCLKWNDYQENVVATLSELRQEEDFFDVTLACEGEQIRAHKLVLSACSAFFRRLLKMNPGQNPVIVLWDVAFNDLVNIVDFMYNGEVKVRQANIQSFLTVAEKFRVRGLCQNDTGGATGQGESTTTKGESGRASPTASAAANHKPSSKKGSSPRSKSPTTSKRIYSPETNESSAALSTPANKRPRANDDYGDDDDNGPLTPDVSIREESHYRGTSEHGIPRPGEGTNFQDFLHGGDPQAGDSSAGAFDERPGLQAALMGMGMSSLLDPSTAKEFLRRAAALGVNPAAMAAAAANTSSSSATTSPSASQNAGGGGGGAGSPMDPALRRPRSVYNSQQVAQLEAYFRFNEYIDGERKRKLSHITNIPEHQIKVWFQNRRQKKKREEAEQLQSGSTSHGVGGIQVGSSGLEGSRPGLSGHSLRDEEGADYPPRGSVFHEMTGNEVHAGNVEDEDEEEDVDRKPDPVDIKVHFHSENNH